jgi:AraC-like DNA-binding protein
VRHDRGLNKPAIAARRTDQGGGHAFVASIPDEPVVEQRLLPRLGIGPGWAIYVGPVQQNRAHRHHLVQIAWSPIAAFELVAGPYRRRAAGHVVDAGAPHCLQSTEAVRLLFLDPAMPIAMHWRSISRGNACEISISMVQELEARLHQWDFASAGEPQDGPSQGLRELALMDWLKVELDQPLRALDAAQIVGLSEGRFLHWFKQKYGLPFRAYVRWLRLQEALRRLAGGSNLTQAAHAAGFSDSAHLSRTFATSFGIAPRGLHNVEITLSQSGGPRLDGIPGT